MQEVVVADDKRDSTPKVRLLIRRAVGYRRLAGSLRNTQLSQPLPDQHLHLGSNDSDRLTKLTFLLIYFQALVRASRGKHSWMYQLKLVHPRGPLLQGRWKTLCICAFNPVERRSNIRFFPPSALEAMMQVCSNWQTDSILDHFYISRSRFYSQLKRALEQKVPTSDYDPHRAFFARVRSDRSSSVRLMFVP